MKKDVIHESQVEVKFESVDVDAKIKAAADVKIKRFQELTEEEIKMVAGAARMRTSP